MPKRTLSILLIILFNSYVAKANNEIKGLEEINYNGLKNYETTLNLETTFKFNYDKHFTKDSLLDKSNTYNIDLFNSKFKIKFYDDIELHIPFRVNYKRYIPSNLSDKNIEKLLLIRTIVANIGFSLSWKALDYLKLGVNGDTDEENGYVLNFESDLTALNSDMNDIKGSDKFKYGLGIFGQFDLKKSYLEFKPKIRLKFNKDVKEDKNSNILSQIDKNIIFTPLISLPLDLKFEVIEDLKFIINLSLNSYTAFFNKKCSHKSILKLDSFIKLILEYKLFNIFKLTLPIKSSLDAEFFKKEKIILKDGIHFSPKVDFSLDILNNLKLLADLSFEYYRGVKFNKHSWSKLKWGVGFKFNSSI